MNIFSFRSLVCVVVLTLSSASVQAAPILTAGDFIQGGQLVGGEFLIGFAGTNATQNNWPANESPDHAIDGVGQKYLNFAEFDTGFLVTPTFNSGLGAIPTSITVWTANDAEERDPASFTLYGTNVDVSTGGPYLITDFTQIATDLLALPSTRQGNAATPLDTDTNGVPAITSQQIIFPNSAGYTSFLVIFPTVKNSAAANSMQVGEVQLDGTAVPEPGAVALLGGMVAGMAVLRRRRC